MNNKYCGFNSRRMDQASLVVADFLQPNCHALFVDEFERSWVSVISFAKWGV